MTIKLTLNVEPVHETAEVHVTQWREGTDPAPGQDKKPVADYTFVVTAGLVNSPAFEVEVGDKVRVEIQPSHRIVLDKEQFVAKVEDLNSEEVRAEREKEQKERKEAEKAVEEDKKARMKEGERLDQQYRKEAEEQEVPVRPVPAVPPLPKKDVEEKAQEGDKAQVPPKGGAKDSKEVKAGK